MHIASTNCIKLADPMTTPNLMLHPLGLKDELIHILRDYFLLFTLSVTSLEVKSIMVIRLWINEI